MPSSKFSRVLERLYAAKKGSDRNQFLRLREHLNAPDRSYPIIHVGGTNGKGSICTKIAKAFELEGFRVGLFTSPHLISFRERIKVGSTLISEIEVIEKLEKLFSLSDTLTFFEYATLLAFDYFKEQKVDIAVVEVGLGGRLDPTNIITPILSIITSISFDHTELLGNTLEEIGREKAGIVKKNIPVVIGPKARISSIYEKAQKEESPLFEIEGTYQHYDEENRAIARGALHVLRERFSLSETSIEHALHAKPSCRFEAIDYLQQPIILDVAHNPDAFVRLFEAIKERYLQQPVRAIFGISKEKDWKTVLSILSQETTHIHLIEANSSRKVETGLLAEQLNSTGCHSFSEDVTMDLALKKALPMAAAKGEILLICGSFYIMEEALSCLK